MNISKYQRRQFRKQAERVKKELGLEHPGYL